jgi:hypothetical protein
MTSGQQRSNRSTLNKKETIVHVVAGCKSYAEMLGDLPAFSSCAREVLEEFAAHGRDKLDFATGETVWRQTNADQNLYVVVSGSAVLDAGDDISVALEPAITSVGLPGTRFWSARRCSPADDMEVLVIILRNSLNSSAHHRAAVIPRTSNGAASSRPPPPLCPETLVTACWPASTAVGARAVPLSGVSVPT